MGSYKEKEYYDDIYSVREAYKCNYKESPYFELWNECIKYIPESAKILEVGCGVGQFYSMLIDKTKIDNYNGFDFSSVAIEMHPSPNAYVGDATKKDNYLSENQYNLIICKEVLEHLQDDIDVIRKWKKGVDVLLTVPCFNDPAHVRYFSNEAEIRNRYEKIYHCLSIEKVIVCSHWFIIIGKTR